MCQTFPSLNETNAVSSDSLYFGSKITKLGWLNTHIKWSTVTGVSNDFKLNIGLDLEVKTKEHIKKGLAGIDFQSKREAQEIF